MTRAATYRELMHYVHRAALLGDRVGERMFQQRAGVGRAMYLVLRAVDAGTGGGPVSQQAIAGRLSLTKGAISKHVAAAQASGWLSVQPSPVSRREHALTVTEAGQQVLARGRSVQEYYQQLTDERLADEDVAAAVRVLRAMCDLLEQEEKA